MLMNKKEDVETLNILLKSILVKLDEYIKCIRPVFSVDMDSIVEFRSNLSYILRDIERYEMSHDIPTSIDYSKFNVVERDKLLLNINEASFAFGNNPYVNHGTFKDIVNNTITQLPFIDTDMEIGYDEYLDLSRQLVEYIESTSGNNVMPLNDPEDEHNKFYNNDDYYYVVIANTISRTIKSDYSMFYGYSFVKEYAARYSEFIRKITPSNIEVGILSIPKPKNEDVLYNSLIANYNVDPDDGFIYHINSYDFKDTLYINESTIENLDSIIVNNHVYDSWSLINGVINLLNLLTPVFNDFILLDKFRELSEFILERMNMIYVPLHLILKSYNKDIIEHFEDEISDVNLYELFMYDEFILLDRCYHYTSFVETHSALIFDNTMDIGGFVI